MNEMNKMNKINEQRWEDHSDFLAEFAGNIAYLLVTFESGNKHEKVEAIEHLVKTLSFSAFKHAEGHCREDFENGALERVFEHGKVVGASRWPDVSENQVVGDISVSGDRVKREDGNRGCGGRWNDAKRAPVDSGGSDEPSWDEYKKRWKEATPVCDNHRQEWNYEKRAPVADSDFNSDADYDYNIDDDDMVITSQEECAKRFAEGQAVCRNYAGIND